MKRRPRTTCLYIQLCLLLSPASSSNCPGFFLRFSGVQAAVFLCGLVSCSACMAMRPRQYELLVSFSVTGHFGPRWLHNSHPKMWVHSIRTFWIWADLSLGHFVFLDPKCPVNFSPGPNFEVSRDSSHSRPIGPMSRSKVCCVWSFHNSLLAKFVRPTDAI